VREEGGQDGSKGLRAEKRKEESTTGELVDPKNGTSCNLAMILSENGIRISQI